MVVFEADYDEIKPQNIVMTPFQLDVITITSQKIFQFGPLPTKIFGYASDFGLII